MSGKAREALVALRYMAEGYDNHFNAGTPLIAEHVAAVAARIAELDAEVRLATGDAETQFRKRRQAEVALENMTQQRNAAIVKSARARIADLEADLAEIGALWSELERTNPDTAHIVKTRWAEGSTS